MFVKNEIVKVDVIVCEYANDDERHPQSLVLEHCEVPLQQHSVKWANHLRYVSTTVNQAAMRADAMLEAGDLDGYAVWRRILRAVGELLRVGPASEETTH